MSEYYKLSTPKAAPASLKKQPVGKRKSNRFPVRNATIKLRKTGMLKYILLSTNNQATLVNLSKSGLQLMLPETLKAEDNYQINLYIPGLVNPLIMKARVVWCRPYKKFYDKTYFRAGLQFVKINPEVKTMLRKLELAALRKAKGTQNETTVTRGMVQTAS